MFDSLTVYQLRICGFGVVDFDGTGTIDTGMRRCYTNGLKPLSAMAFGTVT